MPSTPPLAPAKKGLPAIAWVGIGCLGIVVIGVIIAVFAGMAIWGSVKGILDNPEKTAAEMVVKMNPELETVSNNDDKGEMTIRTKDGKEMTLSYKDISEGRLEITDSEGNTTRIGNTDLSQVPAWVPRASDLTNGFSTYHSDSGRQISGQFSGKSSMSPEDLRSFFEAEASSLGMTSNYKSSSANGVSVLSLTFSGGGKSLTVVITGKPGEATLVNTAYSQSK
ncbi:MAG: hypothetical protein NWQ16_05505 [Akkermansiaceae bacterium]|nr:hypothetical protein [Akkermansiaceae bacterium]